jgi:hypothetical protein
MENNIPRARGRRLTYVILVTHKTEMRKSTVQSQPRQVFYEPISPKYASQKKGWWSGSKCWP